MCKVSFVILFNKFFMVFYKQREVQGNLKEESIENSHVNKEKKQKKIEGFKAMMDTYKERHTDI